MSVRNRLGLRLPVFPVAAGTALLLLMSANSAASAGTLARHGPAAAASDPPAARNIPVSASELSRLEQIYASGRGIPRSDIASIARFSVRGAYVPATRTQWATASFIPSLKDPVSVVARFQDGARTGVFARPAGGSWRLLRIASVPLACDGVLPASVQRAWQLTSRAACPTATPAGPSRRPGSVVKPDTVDPATIVQLAEDNVGVGDTPASTSFSFDCTPYTTLVGAGASSSGCGTDPTFQVTDENQEWCANFAKYIWEQGGVTASLGTLNPGANSFGVWGHDQGENLSFDGANPVPGDAVVFYPAGSTSFGDYADHVGIVASVNSNGTVNLIDGDFAGSSNITVQENDDVSIASWAADIWGANEEWVYVSPGQIRLSGDVTYAPGSHGSQQELFGRDTSGETWEDWESSSGSWSGWHGLGGTVASDLTYAPGMNGSVQEIFARSSAGTPQEDWEYSGGSWSGWTSLGGTISSSMTYGSVDGLQEVWAHNSAGTVYVDVQDSSGWSGWLSLGGGAVGNITWAPGADGAVQEVFARTSNGSPWGDVQTSSGWSGWIGLGGTIASDITYAPGSAGSAQEIFGVNSAGTVWENWESSSGSWSGWNNLGP